MKLTFPLTLTVLVPVCRGQINVSVTAGPNPAVSASGSIKHIITDQEAEAFGLGPESTLENDIKTYWGDAPDDAYLKINSGSWGDLYTTYDWPQVETTLTAVSAEVVGINTKPVVLDTKLLKDAPTGLPGTYTADISSQVQQTVTSSWSDTSTFSFTQSVTYGVTIDGLGLSGTTSFSYSEAAMQGGSHSTASTVGSSSGVTVDLQPGQEVEAVLSASQGSMTVKVTYVVSLTGCVEMNYGNTYKGHHFWCIDVGSILDSIGKSNEVYVTETLEIGFYTGGEVQLQDASTGSDVAYFAAKPADPSRRFRGGSSS